ncbi:MAG: SGNH/GDSL hydrolase family protein [Pseudomonadota bacterium]
MRIKKQFMIIFLMALVISLSGGSATAFDTVVVFGDSLSDNGNLFQAGLSQFPDPHRYWQGRFSNGPVWVEYLTDPDMLNASLVDRAIGGAQTGGLESAELLAQVYFHINATASPSSNTLFVIWIGGNDFLSGDRNAKASVEKIRSALQILTDYGAGRFLLLNLPDLGATPRYSGTSDVQTATNFSIEFNTELSQIVAQFQQANSQILIYQLDIYTMFSEIIQNPNPYGFSNVTEESPNFSVEDNFDNSAGYMFWDNKHPTTETHALIADRAFLLVDDTNETPNETPDEGSKDDDSTCFISTLLFTRR